MARKKVKSTSSNSQFAAQQRRRAGAAAHDPGHQRLHALSSLLERKEKQQRDSADTHNCRLQMADACMEACQWDRAADVLDKAFKNDPPDRRGVQRRLAPLLLRLGRHDALRSLLSQSTTEIASDAALACCSLLLTLASWAGGNDPDATESAAAQAFEVAYQANWHATLLLCAWRAGAALPGNLVLGARLTNSSSAAASSAASSSDTTAAPAGGIEEAYALGSRAFGGWAGPPDAPSDEEDEDEGGEEFPGLRGVAHWLGAQLLQRPPAASTDGLQGDGRRFVRHFNTDVLGPALEEVTERVARAAEADDDEEEEGEGEGEEAVDEEEEEGEEEEEEEEEEEGEEDEGEDGEEEEEEEEEEAADGDAVGEASTAPIDQQRGSAAPKRDRAAFEQWRKEKQVMLRQKKARAAERGVAELSGDSSGEDSGDED